MSLVPTSRIMAKLLAGQSAGLRKAAEAVAEQSDRNAPTDTGDLVESRRIRVGKRQASITYGEGLPDPRAVINHEKTDIRHTRGEPKYLERALASELPKIRLVIQSELKKHLEP